MGWDGWDGLDLRVGGGIEHLTVLITARNVVSTHCIKASFIEVPKMR